MIPRSGAAVRQRMTHRALVQRDSGGAADGYGNPPAPTWTTLHASLPCWYYVAPGGEFVRDRGVVVGEEPKMLVPYGTDITEQDRVVAITDRRGAVISGIAMNILSVVPRHDHLEIMLRAVA